eukprot:972128-Pyramimonas_sp.AAC.1
MAFCATTEACTGFMHTRACGESKLVQGKSSRPSLGRRTFTPEAFKLQASRFALSSRRQVSCNASDTEGSRTATVKPLETKSYTLVTPIVEAPAKKIVPVTGKWLHQWR